MANLFFSPQITVSGEGALELAQSQISRLGKKALIVTDEVMVKLGNVSKLTDLLTHIAVKFVIYSEINNEPNDLAIEKGAALYRHADCDFLIGLGGGSPIDAMKAIGIVVSSSGSICDHLGKIIDTQSPAMCAIPTTAGTGSEATQVTIITNTEAGIKMLLKGPSLLPNLAIVDPIFMRSLPPEITAATGIDALCHAVEAYTSRKAFDLSDTMAVSAIRRIFASLRPCHKNGDDMAARTQMAIASYEAGLAFSNASVTIIHGMSRPIGALFHVPHGISNSMLIGTCLEFAIHGCPERFCFLAKEIGVYEQGMSDFEGAQAFVRTVTTLCKDLGIKTLAEFGIPREAFFAQIDKMAIDALASGSPGNTVRQPSKEEIVTIYQSLYEAS